MKNRIDYSIYYRRWHSGSLQELKSSTKMYDYWIGGLIQQLPSSAQILDYGCGFGSLVSYLKQHFNDVEGVDASAEQIAVARQNNLPVEVLPTAEFSSWCARRVEAFDAIFLFDVLEHIPAPDQIDFLRSLAQTLKKQGVMFIKAPNANSLLASRWRYNDWTHTSAFTECSLDFVCLNSGFEEVEYFDDESSMKSRFWWIPRWNNRYVFIKLFFRSIWKMYLRAELGDQANAVRVGYNLFARARKR
jgi:SAM-dependent methyltransferase